MSQIFDSILEQLQGPALESLSKAIGTDGGGTQKALAAALPALLGGLAKNVQEPGQAEALRSALERDHDGAIMGDVQGFLGMGDGGAGASILGHIFGGRKGQVEQNVSKASGMDLGTIMKLLPLLAPVVMGALGKMRSQGNSSASDLTDILGREAQGMEKRAPKGGFLTNLLDRDGDGDVDFGDLTKGLLGRFLR